MHLSTDQLQQIQRRATGADPGTYHSILQAQQDRADLLLHVLDLEAEIASLRDRLTRVGIALLDRDSLR